MYTPSNTPVAPITALTTNTSITGMMPVTGSEGTSRVPLLKAATPTFNATRPTPNADGTSTTMVVSRLALDSVDTVIMAHQLDGKSSKTFFNAVDKFPVCKSSNGDTPDAGCKQPQSADCQSCRQNQPGSGRQGGASKACSFHVRIAVVEAANPNMVFSMYVPASSAIGASGLESAGRYNLFAYLKFLGSLNRTSDTVVTRIEFDSAAQPTMNKITFQAVAHCPDALTRHISNEQYVSDAIAYTRNTPPPQAFRNAQAPVAQAPVAQAPVALAPLAQAPVAQAPVAQAPAVDPRDAMIAQMHLQMQAQMQAMQAMQASLGIAQPAPGSVLPLDAPAIATAAPVMPVAPIAPVAQAPAVDFNTTDPFKGVVLDENAAWAVAFKPV